MRFKRRKKGVSVETNGDGQPEVIEGACEALNAEPQDWGRPS